MLNCTLVLTFAGPLRGIVMLAYLNVGLATQGSFPPGLLAHGTGLLVISLAFHLLLRWRASYADPLLLPIVTLLNGLGLVMIHRLDIIANHPLAPLVERPIAEHHLRVDGQGYPGRLQGTSPWVITRVVSIADAFDAMRSFHPFRREAAVQHALETLEEERGRQFDDALARTFVELVRTGGVGHPLKHAASGLLETACPECNPIFTLPSQATAGKDVECPSSEGAFVLRFAPDSFDLRWTGHPARWN